MDEFFFIKKAKTNLAAMVRKILKIARLSQYQNYVLVDSSIFFNPIEVMLISTLIHCQLIDRLRV